MPSNALVSGLSDSQYNGLYVYDGINNERSTYRLNANINIYWDGAAWILEYSENGNAETVIYSNDDVAYPWLAIWELGTATGTPVVTEIPAQPTFGLPADVVALITSRFGSVANFLRLRNQGQI